MKKNERDFFSLQEWLNTKELTAYEKLLCIVLFTAADGGAECSLTIADLASLCSCSSKQIEKVLNSLEDKKLVLREAQYLDGKRHQTANKYILHFGV